MNTRTALSAQTKTIEKRNWTRYFNKDLIAFLISVALAVASVFLIGPWIDSVMLLDWQAVGLIFTSSLTTFITYYIAKTHYSKGSMNVLKKIFWVSFFAVLTVGLALGSTMVMGGVASIVSLTYALTGIFIVSVIFYMVSLSSETLGLLGMAALSIFLGSLIAGGSFYGYLGHEATLWALQGALLIILAVGGVFAKWRMYLHGIRGVNNDGGFKSPDDYGDGNDGDGDTGIE